MPSRRLEPTPPESPEPAGDGPRSAPAAGRVLLRTLGRGAARLGAATLVGALALGPGSAAPSSPPAPVEPSRSPAAGRAAAGSALQEEGDPAGARGDASLGRLEVALWPEYDRPDMLVIYRATLAADTELPTEIRFEIPAAAGEPNAVAGTDSAGRLVNLDYERRVEGGRAFIVLTASRPDLQIEYYDPDLERDGARRAYVFVWPGHPAVAELTVRIQRPVGANELTVTPEAAARGVADDGLVYAEVPLGRVPAGETRRVELQYLKPDQGLTADALAATGPAADASSPAGAAPSAEVPVGWIVGGVALVLAAALAAFLLMGRTGAAADPPAAVGGAGAPGAAGTAPPGKGTHFCTRCGAPAEEEDRFCHACGAALRGASG